MEKLRQATFEQKAQVFQFVSCVGRGDLLNIETVVEERECDFAFGIQSRKHQVNTWNVWYMADDEAQRLLVEQSAKMGLTVVFSG